jgi:hypothetical protein
MIFTPPCCQIAMKRCPARLDKPHNQAAIMSHAHVAAITR